MFRFLRIASGCLIALACCTSASAQIYKCKDASGALHYQDRPCAQDQRGTAFDPEAGNVTTLDSEAARREAQGALATREQIRDQNTPARPPATAAPTGGAAVGAGAMVDRVETLPYPVYRDDGRRGDRDRRRDDRRRGRDRDDRGLPRRPDETPMMDPPRAIGSGSPYVPDPPTSRQISPRAANVNPASSSSTRGASGDR